MAEIKIHERRVWLSNIEATLSRLSLDKLLAIKGIDTAMSYTQVDHPWMDSHLYIQQVRTNG